MDGGPQRDVEIVQLMGGLSSIALASTGQELARTFAERLGARHRYLHAPALFASAERLAAMLDEPSIRIALDAATADIALVGIGTARRGSFIALIQASSSARENAAGSRHPAPPATCAATSTTPLTA
jgi:DNA-binding transcriptional regulator LsrR (DeoR family)